MANVGNVRTRAQLFTDGLLSGNIPSTLRYFTELSVGSPTTALEFFINGVEGQRFYLPTNSVVNGIIMVSAWNPVAATAADNFCETVNFVGYNIGGTISLDTPTVLHGNVNINTSMAVVADDVNKAVTFTITPTLNSSLILTAALNYSFSALDIQPVNYYSVSG